MYFWSRHVDFCGETFGDLVAGWKPVNEPVAYALVSFLTGAFPPGRRDPDDFRIVRRAILRADAAAARLLRGAGAPIATIHNLSPIYPADSSPEARRAAARVDDGMWKSWQEPEFLDPFDYVGFSYYSAMAVRGDGSVTHYPVNARVGPMGYAPWPSGLGEVLHRLSEDLPDRPLLISEHGVGTTDDAWRVELLREALDEVDRAIADGVDVRGFFHWTSVDNYEWLSGYDVPFGLFDRDRNMKD
jgi:beta-glucosidase